MRINHLSPLRCMMCRLSPVYEEMPLCNKCLSRFHELLADKCKTCGKTSLECTCTDREGLRFLFFYGSYYSKRVIFHVKHDMDVATMDFLATFTVSATRLKMDSFDAIAFVPRSKRNKRRNGYDQSEEFAKSLSRAYGVPIIYALERKGNREQKLLSRSERIKNIKKSFAINKDIENEKKYNKILLVDDIATTGATMTACAELLREHIARQVVRLVLAKRNYFDPKGSQL